MGEREQRCPTSPGHSPSPCCPVSHEGTAGLWPWLCKPSLAVSCSGSVGQGPRGAAGLPLGGRCIAAVSQHCPLFLQSPLFLAAQPWRWGVEQQEEGPHQPAPCPGGLFHRIESL